MIAYNKQSGFTLIELLVVTAIISLLSSIVLSSVQTVRTRATNVKYATELRSLQQAILSYEIDKNQKILCTNPSFSQCYDFGGQSWFDGALNPLIIEKYISKIPHYGNWPFNSNPFNPGNWAYATYQPNYYQGNNVEFSCHPVVYTNWKIGSLPGILIVASNQKLPLSDGFNKCETGAAQCIFTPSPGSGLMPYIYCLPLN